MLLLTRTKQSLLHSCCCMPSCKYALDVNAERAEDVLTHKSLLQNAKDPENRPTFRLSVRPTTVLRLNGPAKPARTVGFRKRDSARIPDSENRPGPGKTGLCDGAGTQADRARMIFTMRFRPTELCVRACVRPTTFWERFLWRNRPQRP